jgi:hypothetical protein
MKKGDRIGTIFGRGTIEQVYSRPFRHIGGRLIWFYGIALDSISTPSLTAAGIFWHVPQYNKNIWQLNKEYLQEEILTDKEKDILECKSEQWNGRKNETN